MIALSLVELVHHLRTIFLLSFITFVVAMLLTPVFTHFAYKYKWWKTRKVQEARTQAVDGSKMSVIASMRIKRTIPRMAGIITVVSVTAVTVFGNLSRGQTWLAVTALIGGGIIGLLDDIINIRGGGGGKAGMRPLIKLGMITIVASVCAWFFYFKLGYTSVLVPFVGNVEIGLLLIPLAILAIVSTANAVNISDGVDGLAGGLLISAYAAFAVIAVLQGNYGIAGFCMTVVGALLAYVWFNIPPARFVMGDVGSFALGTALGVVAMMTDTIFLLPLIAFVFVVEAGSTLLQIFSKKVFHRKIFIAAPIHHHFEATGWPKTKVTMRFWIIGQVCAVFGVFLALVGGYII
ncbi:phospho-N-acetylmuramoyl-pentapeptide-transferase [soil metagenome]